VRRRPPSTHRNGRRRPDPLGTVRERDTPVCRGLLLLVLGRAIDKNDGPRLKYLLLEKR
jgi:hypothetical protein